MWGGATPYAVWMHVFLVTGDVLLFGDGQKILRPGETLLGPHDGQGRQQGAASCPGSSAAFCFLMLPGAGMCIICVSIIWTEQACALSIVWVWPLGCWLLSSADSIVNELSEHYCLCCCGTLQAHRSAKGSPRPRAADSRIVQCAGVCQIRLCHFVSHPAVFT